MSLGPHMFTLFLETFSFAPPHPNGRGGNAQPLPVAQVLSGAMSIAYATVGLHFLRFWRNSKDSLYGMFAAAFFLLAIQRLGLGLYSERMEDDTPFYMIRLTAYCLILGAIWTKNRPTPPKA